MKENPYKNFKVGDMSKENYSTRNIDLHRPMWTISYSCRRKASR